LLNSIYSSVSPDFRFKETLFVNFFTDPELSSSLYLTKKIPIDFFMVTPAYTLGTRHACEFVSYDIKHHFQLKISDINWNKLN